MKKILYGPDPDLLKKLMFAAGDAYDDATPYFEAYVKTQNSMFTKENLEYIKMFASTTTDTGFKLIFNNQSRFDDVEGSGKANEFLQSGLHPGNISSIKKTLYCLSLK